ncbi:hypothetical protein ACP5PY_24480 [Photobacterium leiognathi subsp. mandapamensis]
MMTLTVMALPISIDIDDDNDGIFDVDRVWVMIQTICTAIFSSQPMTMIRTNVHW